MKKARTLVRGAAPRKVMTEAITSRSNTAVAPEPPYAAALAYSGWWRRRSAVR
jgi:hypothetical protein